MNTDNLAKTKISETEFARLCDGIYEDREIIWKHNPIGTREEILLWMLMCVLVSYLSLEEIETPCFNGKPDAQSYRQAINTIVRSRREKYFNPEKYISKFS